MQADHDLTKLYDQTEATGQKNDSDTIQTLTKKADTPIANSVLNTEIMDGLD